MGHTRTPFTKSTEQFQTPNAPVLHNRGVRFRLLWAISRFTRQHPWKRMSRLLRLVYSPYKRQADHIEAVIDYDVGLFINVDTASFIEWNLFFFGYYEPEITNVIKRLVKPGCVAVDVGANIGCHAIVMAHAAGPNGMVIAFEPHPVVRERLIRNINLNRLSNIVPCSLALSNEAGQAALYSSNREDANQGISSFYNVHAEFAFPPETMSVEVDTLDAVMQRQQLARLDFIKIDTEGNEVRVVQGGVDSIRKFRPSIVFEYSDELWADAGVNWESMAGMLSAVGYEFYEIKPHYLLRIGQAPLRGGANILASPSGNL